MKAVIYARYSSDNQREESIEGQLRECSTRSSVNKQMRKALQRHLNAQISLNRCAG